MGPSHLALLCLVAWTGAVEARVEELNEQDAANVREPTVAILAVHYQKYVPDSGFESNLSNLLRSASLNLISVTCKGSEEGLCTALHGHHLGLLSMDHAPKPMTVEPHPSAAVFVTRLLRAAHPKLIKEFTSAEQLNKALLRQKPVFIAFIPADNEDDLMNYVVSAKASAQLQHKFGLVEDINVVGGATPRIPAHLRADQTVLWYSDVIGDARGWKMGIFDRGLKGFSTFVKTATYPTYVHYNGKESHSVFKGSGLPQVFILVNDTTMDAISTFVHPLAADLIGDFAIMTVNIDTHPKMLKHFIGTDTENLPDVFFRPTPKEVLGLDAAMKKDPVALAAGLRAVYRDYSSAASGEGAGPGEGDHQYSPTSIIDMTPDEFRDYDVNTDIAIVAAFIGKQSHQVRSVLEEVLDSTLHLIGQVVFIIVEVSGGLSSVTPPGGVHVLSFPMVMVRCHDNDTWFQYERDLSYIGLLSFLSKTMNLSSEVLDDISHRHQTLVQENAIANREGSGDPEVIPKQMVEDDEYGRLVTSEGIKAEQFRGMELTADRYQQLLLRQEGAGSVVAFFQPWSVRSRAALPLMEHLRTELEGTGVTVATVDCQQYPDVCDPLETVSYPRIRLHPPAGGIPQDYTGPLLADHITRALTGSAAVSMATSYELTPDTLPLKLSEGKSLTILVVPQGQSPLIQRFHEVREGKPRLSLAWIDHSKYGDLLVVNGSCLRKDQVPVWVAMDMSMPNIRVFTCKVVNGAIDGSCLGSDFTKFPWQTSKLSYKQWAPHVKPFSFPSNLGSESSRSKDDLPPSRDSPDLQQREGFPPQLDPSGQPPFGSRSRRHEEL